MMKETTEFLKMREMSLLIEKVLHIPSQWMKVTHTLVITVKFQNTMDNEKFIKAFKSEEKHSYVKNQEARSQWSKTCQILRENDFH